MFFYRNTALCEGVFARVQNNPRGHVYASKSSFILLKAGGEGKKQENYSEHEA